MKTMKQHQQPSITTMAPLLLLLLPSLLLSHHPLATATTIYNVVALGARGDGRTLSTSPLLKAWSLACGASKPAVIYVPPGRYLIGNTHFSGQCRNGDVTIRIDGVLVSARSGYGNAGYWILFEGVSGITILGGLFDGDGSGLWACKASGGSCPAGSTTLGFTNSNNIKISGLTSLNSQMFHIVINGCHNVKLQGVTVKAPGDSPNTDGIHVQLSSYVSILSSIIQTGDDCVSIGAGTTNLWIENVACGPGHGISIGSLAKDSYEPGVKNVTVKRVSFTGTQNGARIKTWSRPSSGFVKDVLFQHIIMNNVQNPIVIDQHYCPNNKGCPGQVSGVKVSDITYQDIRGTSATEVAVKFDCSKGKPCSGIRLQDVRLTYKNQKARSMCANAGGETVGVVQPSSCF